MAIGNRPFIGLPGTEDDYIELPDGQIRHKITNRTYRFVDMGPISGEGSWVHSGGTGQALAFDPPPPEFGGVNEQQLRHVASSMHGGIPYEQVTEEMMRAALPVYYPGQQVPGADVSPKLTSTITTPEVNATQDIPGSTADNILNAASGQYPSYTPSGFGGGVSGTGRFPRQYLHGGQSYTASDPASTRSIEQEQARRRLGMPNIWQAWGPAQDIEREEEARYYLAQPYMGTEGTPEQFLGGPADAPWRAETYEDLLNRAALAGQASMADDSWAKMDFTPGGTWDTPTARAAYQLRYGGTEGAGYRRDLTDYLSTATPSGGRWGGFMGDAMRKQVERERSLHYALGGDPKTFLDYYVQQRRGLGGAF